MPIRPLGRTGIMLGVVGLGTVKFGRVSGVKYPGEVRMPSEQEAGQLLAAAEALGMNLLDTAPAYGNAEVRLGRLLRGRTHPWFVITKAGEHWNGESSSFDFSESSIEASIDNSRKQLGLDVLGCMLLHSDGVAERTDDGFAGAVRALRRAKEAGFVRTIGASVKSAQGARNALEWADVLMLEFGSDLSMREVSIRSLELGVGILAKKALASGHLSKLGPDPVRSAMQRTLSIPGVCSVVVGTTNVGHLQENCEAAARAADDLKMDRHHRETDA